MCGPDCLGGSGTSGRGRTSYSPKKNGSSPWTEGSRKVSSGGAATRDRRASEFGMPKVKISFSSRKK